MGGARVDSPVSLSRSPFSNLTLLHVGHCVYFSRTRVPFICYSRDGAMMPLSLGNTAGRVPRTDQLRPPPVLWIRIARGHANEHGDWAEMVPFEQEQKVGNNVIVGALYPPANPDDCQTIADLGTKLGPGVNTLFRNIIPSAPKSVPCSHLDAHFLRKLYEDPSRRTDWVKRMCDAVRRMYEYDEGANVKQDFFRTPVIYIGGDACYESWRENSYEYFELESVISKDCGVYEYKVKGTEERGDETRDGVHNHKVIVMEGHPHPSSTLKWGGGNDRVTEVSKLTVALIKLLVLEDPPEEVVGASWVNAKHRHLLEKLDAENQKQLRRRTALASGLREWFGGPKFASMNPDLIQKALACERIFLRLFTAIKDKDVDAFIGRLEMFFELLGGELLVQLFANSSSTSREGGASMALAVAGDHNRNFFWRAHMYFLLLGGNRKVWVRLFSRNSMAAAVVGNRHELFDLHALKLHKKLKDKTKFFTLMQNNSIASRLKKDDEDFVNLICEWMPRLNFPSRLQGLEGYFVELGKPFFKFVASKDGEWMLKHSVELRRLLKERGRVTPDNLEGILRGICKPAPTSTSTPVLVSSTTTTTTTRSSSSSSTHTVRSSKRVLDDLPSSPTRPSKMARTQSAGAFVSDDLTDIPDPDALAPRFEEQPGKFRWIPSGG